MASNTNDPNSLSKLMGGGTPEDEEPAEEPDQAERPVNGKDALTPEQRAREKEIAEKARQVGNVTDFEAEAEAHFRNKNAQTGSEHPAPNGAAKHGDGASSAENDYDRDREPEENDQATAAPHGDHNLQIMDLGTAYRKAKRKRKRQDGARKMVQAPIDQTRQRVTDLRNIAHQRPNRIPESALDPFKSAKDPDQQFIVAVTKFPLAIAYKTADKGRVLDGGKGPVIKDDSTMARFVALASIQQRGWDAVCINGGKREYQEQLRDFLQKQGVAAYLWEDLVKDPEATLDHAQMGARASEPGTDTEPGQEQEHTSDIAPNAQQPARMH